MSKPLRTVGCTTGVLPAAAPPTWDDNNEEDGDGLFLWLKESVTLISVEEDLDLDLSVRLLLGSLAFIFIEDNSGLLPFLLQLPFVLLIEGNGSDPI